MRVADWLVFGATLGYVALYGLWRARGTNDVRTFVLAGRHVPWYAVGLSIMATQAITAGVQAELIRRRLLLAPDLRASLVS